MNRRSGGTAVEFSIVAPVFFLLVLAMIEFGRMVMCYQVLTNAAREAARVGALPGATTVNLIQRGNAKLAAGAVRGATVSVVPAEIAGLNQGDRFTVTVEGPYDAMSWLPIPQWLGGRHLVADVTMVREGK